MDLDRRDPTSAVGFISFEKNYGDGGAKNGRSLRLKKWCWAPELFGPEAYLNCWSLLITNYQG